MKLMETHVAHMGIFEESIFAVQIVVSRSNNYEHAQCLMLLATRCLKLANSTMSAS